MFQHHTPFQRQLLKAKRPSPRFLGNRCLLLFSEDVDLLMAFLPKNNPRKVHISWLSYLWTFVVVVVVSADDYSCFFCFSIIIVSHDSIIRSVRRSVCRSVRYALAQRAETRRRAAY